MATIGSGTIGSGQIGDPTYGESRDVIGGVSGPLETASTVPDAKGKKGGKGKAPRPQPKPEVPAPKGKKDIQRKIQINALSSTAVVGVAAVTNGAAVLTCVSSVSAVGTKATRGSALLAPSVVVLTDGLKGARSAITETLTHSLSLLGTTEDLGGAALDVTEILEVSGTKATSGSGLLVANLSATVRGKKGGFGFGVLSQAANWTALGLKGGVGIILLTPVHSVEQEGFKGGLGSTALTLFQDLTGVGIKAAFGLAVPDVIETLLVVGGRGTTGLAVINHRTAIGTLKIPVGHVYAEPVLIKQAPLLVAGRFGSHNDNQGDLVTAYETSTVEVVPHETDVDVVAEPVLADVMGV